MKDYDDVRLRRYLLEQLSQDEQDQVEHDLLADDQLFEAAEAVEGDLIDAYVRGQLTPQEQESLARRLASSPRGRARLELARNLRTEADALAPAKVVPFPRRHFVRYAIAASLVGVVALGFWSQTAEPPSNGPVTQISFPADEIQPRSRGGEPKTATLPPDGRLLLDFPDLEHEDFPAYEVVVSRAGEEVARQRLESGRNSIEVAGEKLTQGLYDLEVRGLPADGEPRPVILSGFEILAE